MHYIDVDLSAVVCCGTLLFLAERAITGLLDISDVELK
jgi:hypothetical protein